MMPHLPYPRRDFIPEPVALAAAPSEPPVARRSDLDLQSQLEAILDAVWRAEADWKFNDRLDLALRQRPDSVAS